jgi:hypothetical protein
VGRNSRRLTTDCRKPARRFVGGISLHSISNRNWRQIMINATSGTTLLDQAAVACTLVIAAMLGFAQIVLLVN